MPIRTITRAKGGTKEKEVTLNSIHIPDLWHVAAYLNAVHMEVSAELVKDCWHLCHDLLRHIKEHEDTEHAGRNPG